MHYLEGNRCERAGRVIAKNFVGADPIVSLMLALHILSARVDRIASTGLFFERFAFGAPVFERTFFEIEVQRLAIGAQRQDSGRHSSGSGGEAQKEQQNEDTFKFTFHDVQTFWPKTTFSADRI